MDNYRNSETPRMGLVIADVDGTLVTPRKVLSEGSRRAVERLHEAGIAFAITSSRPPRGMRMLIEPLRISTPMAGFNGGQFVKPDLSIISREILSADVVESAIRLIESHGLDVWVFCGSDWFVRNLHGPHIDTEEMTVQFSPSLVGNFDNVLDDVAKVVGVSFDHEAVARCEADACKELGDRVSATRSQSYYLDVTHPNANKGMAVRWLSEYHNVPADEIATIGDGLNDVLMFASSGLSIAMGNASPEVQRAARFVTTSNEEEGFANAVERYILCETASTSMAGAHFAHGRH
jgi:Cof subfamily protein (haloacid dehalogenase superfamily)